MSERSSTVPTRALGAAAPGGPSTPGAAANGSLAGLTTLLAQRFASGCPPAAGSAAAATGAIASGLLEWVAARSEGRGPRAFRRRAHAIARRAAALRSALAAAVEADAEAVGAMLRAREPDGATAARRRATGSVLDIAARCSQVVTLALEVATQGHGPIRPDAEGALRLAASASRCALALAEENLRGEADAQAWVSGARRRAWRARLLLQRALPLLSDEQSA